MTLVQHLGILETAGLIRVAAAQPELECAFRHALIQDAAYASLVKHDRQRLHLAVGEALERSYPDRLTSRDLAPLLAQHFDQAGDETRALRYFTLAGDAAARVYANAEAAHHYSRALALARHAAYVDGQTLHHLFFSLGRALELSAQDARALDTYADAEAVARERSNQAMELAAMIARATIYLKPVSVRDPDKGRTLSERTLAMARELGDRELETKSLWNLMQFYKWTGRMANKRWPSLVSSDGVSILHTYCMTSRRSTERAVRFSAPWRWQMKPSSSGASRASSICWRTAWPRLPSFMFCAANTSGPFRS